MNDAEKLILKLYEARMERKAARAARNIARESSGHCEAWRDHDYENGPVCQAGALCIACQDVKPSQDLFLKSANKAGAALRAVLREGKRLTDGAK